MADVVEAEQVHVVQPYSLASAEPRPGYAAEVMAEVIDDGASGPIVTTVAYAQMMSVQADSYVPPQAPTSGPLAVITDAEGVRVRLTLSVNSSGSRFAPGLEIEDCGQCTFCLDKPRYGGPGTKRQKCELKQNEANFNAASAGGYAGARVWTSLHMVRQSEYEKIMSIERMPLPEVLEQAIADRPLPVVWAYRRKRRARTLPPAFVLMYYCEGRVPLDRSELAVSRQRYFKNSRNDTPIAEAQRRVDSWKIAAKADKAARRPRIPRVGGLPQSAQLVPPGAEQDAVMTLSSDLGFAQQPVQQHLMGEPPVDVYHSAVPNNAHPYSMDPMHAQPPPPVYAPDMQQYPPGYAPQPYYQPELQPYPPQPYPPQPYPPQLYPPQPYPPHAPPPGMYAQPPSSGTLPPMYGAPPPSQLSPPPGGAPPQRGAGRGKKRAAHPPTLQPAYANYPPPQPEGQMQYYGMPGQEMGASPQHQQMEAEANSWLADGSAPEGSPTAPKQRRKRAKGGDAAPAAASGDGGGDGEASMSNKTLDIMLQRLQGQLPQDTYERVIELVRDVQLRHRHLSRSEFLQHFQAICAGAPKPV